MSRKELEYRRVIEAVRRSVSLANLELPDQFFPAHLSVAVVDAVFRPDLRQRADAVVHRYCRRFAISRSRTEPWEVPPPAAQETLSDLIHHYDEVGIGVMRDQVFRSRACATGTETSKAAVVLGAARALRDIGVNDLQTVQNRQPGEIEDTLRPLSGFDTRSIRLLLMYLGGKDFVRGDFYLRRYVACALGRKTISSSRTESLVQKAAHELILAPRYLDYAIWRFVLSLEQPTQDNPFSNAN